MDMIDLDAFLGIMQLGLYLVIVRKRGLRWLNRRWWVRPINQRRDNQGDFNHLFQEIKDDSVMFFKYTRMTVHTFHELLDIMSPHLQKRSLRRPLSAEQRLAITLRYLATGDMISSVALAYRIGVSTAGSVIKETSRLIYEVLMPLVLIPPTTEEWLDISQDFQNRWNMPNCIGAIDGKHIMIQCPSNSGSQYFNYKKTFSIVLLSVCDANYKFRLVDTGSHGSCNDGAVYSSGFGNALRDGTLNLPHQPSRLPGSETVMPYFFVGDEAFQLARNMMRPYPGRNLTDEKRIFNYRLSRARRTIENTFGILAARWRIFRRSICMNPETADKIVLATICLHNFLKTINDRIPAGQQYYCPPGYVDYENDAGELIEGAWRDVPNNLGNGARNGPHRGVVEAHVQRDLLAAYFLTPEGQVPWQREYVQRGRNQHV